MINCETNLINNKDNFFKLNSNWEDFNFEEYKEPKPMAPVISNLLADVDSEVSDKLNFTEFVNKEWIDYFSNLSTDSLDLLVYDRSEVSKFGQKYTKDTYLRQLAKYFNTTKKCEVSADGKHYIVNQYYRYPKNYNDGRIFSKKFGIQNCQSAVRGRLLDGVNTDFDMKNAHPNILMYLKNTMDVDGLKDFPTPLFESFLKNRDAFLIKCGITKRDALTVMNSDEAKCGRMGDMKDLDLEWKIIKKMIFNKMKNKLTVTNKINPISSLVNRLMCITENEILQKAIRWFNENGHVVHTPMFDGCTVSIGACINESDIIDGLNTLTKNYGIVWDTKPHDNSIKKDESLIARDNYEPLKVDFEMDHCMIKHPITFICDDKQVVKMYNKNDFITLTGVWQIRSLSGGLEVVNPFFQKWIVDRTRRAYDKMDFLPPPNKCPECVYNLFNGFRHNVLADKGITYDDDTDIDVFLNHVKHLSGSDKTPEIYEYLINYLAHMVQLPGILPQVAVLIKSPQGYGKNLFFESFCKKIFGHEYLLATSKKDQLIGRFTNIERKLMIIADEAGSNKTSFQGNGQIKELITQPIIQMEKKNMNVAPISNFARYLFFSNEDCPVQIEQSDRRFQVIELTGEKPSFDYFTNLANAFEDDSRVLKFVDHLKKVDLSSWKPVNRIFTKFYEEIKSYTVPVELQFMADTFYDSKKDSKFMTSTDLFERFNEWNKLNFPGYSVTKIKLARVICKFKGIEKLQKKIKVSLARGTEKWVNARGFSVDIGIFRDFCDSKGVVLV